MGERFAISSGGHDYECQSTTTRALLSIKLFKRIELDIENETMTLQAGVLWREVYSVIENTGYFIEGGLCPTVGVSGFTLGGGFNWFMSRYFGTAA